MVQTDYAPTVGQPKPLVDGKPKITGYTKFIGDIKLTNMLVAQLVQSDFAHATITNINKEEALKVKGVVAVLTAEDLPGIIPSSRAKLLLARGRVMFYGQPVALVLADNEYAAADGVEKVMVDYEPLPVAISMDDAMADDAPLVWPDGVPGSGNSDAAAHGQGAAADGEVEKEKPTNIVAQTIATEGDVDAAFAGSAHVVEHTFTTPIVHQSSIETQGCIVQPNLATGGVTIWSSTQAPWSIRNEVAGALGVIESDVRVIAAPVGGGFGGKFMLYEILMAAVAQKMRRPVSLILSRMNEMSATNPAPELKFRVKLACDSKGQLTAMDATVIADTGIFPSWIAGAAAYMIRALYRVPTCRVEGINVLTFKPSVAAYRAPSATSVVYVMDSLMEELAEMGGIDSVEMRKLNNTQTDDTLPNGNKMPTVGLHETLDAITAHPIWQNRDQLREEGYGVGLAIGAWFGAVEPGVAECLVNRDDTVHVHVGAVDLTGVTTVFAQLAADTIGVHPDQIRMVVTDTETGPYGGTTGGSRTMMSFAPVVANAAEEARRMLLEIAGQEFEASVDDIEIRDGKVFVKGSPDKAMTLGEIAGKTMSFGGKYAPIHATGRAATTQNAPGYNAQLVQVKVDEETGEVTVIKHVAAQDVGKALNPMLVEGQIMGGAVQGLGWALYEGMLYDNQTGQLLSGTLMDYALPTSEQVGEFETILVEVPSDEGYMGIRGVGEPPVVPTAAAVGNAIKHATGKRLTDLPMSAPRVLAALKK